MSVTDTKAGKPKCVGGKNADETAYAIIKLIGSFIYIVDIGGMKGGYEEESLMALVEAAKASNVKTVLIEKNFGNGAHMAMLRPLFNKLHPVELEEVWESGQKELRIIDVIEPVLTRHQLVISPAVVRKDLRSIEQYSQEVKLTYSLLYQMAMITRDKGCLRHDDRLDALAGAIRHVTESIDFDTQAVHDARKRKDEIEFIKKWQTSQARNSWMGYDSKPKRGRQW